MISNSDLVEATIYRMHLCFSYGASNPMNFLEGMQRYFAPTISSTPFATYSDYTDYLARIAGISVQVILRPHVKSR